MRRSKLTLRSGFPLSGVLLASLAMAQTTTKKTAAPPKPAPQPKTSTPPKPVQQRQSAPSPQRPASIQTQTPPQPSRQLAPSPQTRLTQSQPPLQTAPAPGRSLNPQESQKVSSRIQAERAKASGLNHSPLPSGKWSENANHTMTLAGNNGRNYVVRPGGSLAAFQSPTGHAQFDAIGRVRTMQTHDVYINHNSLGEQRTLGRLPDGGTVVSLGPNRGYVEHSALDHGNRIILRTAIVNGQSTTSIYRPFPYGRSQLLLFQPSVIYSPAFYGWLQAGWASPVAYSWTPPSGPGPAAYAGYYAPQSTYTAPGPWMADYVLTSNLNEAYATPPEAPGLSSVSSIGDDDAPMLAATSDAPITPDVRRQIIAQVEQVVSTQQAEAERPVPPPQDAQPAPRTPAPGTATAAAHEVPAILDPTVQVFLVHTTLVVSAGQRQCQLSRGDILLHPLPVAEGAGTAELTVQNSRKGDCPATIAVRVPVRDLQEMSNHFKESIAACVQTAADQQGNRLPSAPDPKPQRPLDLANQNPQRDATALAQIEQLRTHAKEEENSFQQEIAADPGTAK